MKKRTKGILRNALLFLVIFIVVSSVIVTRNLNSLDEIWNFNFARQMAKGLIPYSDFNMIQMPLLPMIASCFLKIFGEQLIVSRILAAFLGTSILFVTYHILKVLKLNIYIRLLSIMVFFLVFQSFFYLDYNFATLLIVLIMLYLELKKRRKVDKLTSYPVFDIIIGFLAGLCVVLKQSTGIIILVMTIGYFILEIRERKDIKICFKIVFYRLIGALIPIISILIYIAANGAWKDFVDYCILGIQTFSNHISYLSLLESGIWYIKVLTILFPACIIMLCLSSFATKNRVMMLITVYGLAQMTMMFPIADASHFLVGSMPIFIGAIYGINLFIAREICQNTKNTFYLFNHLKYTFIGILFVLVIFALKENLSYLKTAKQYTKFNGYRYVRIDDELSDNIYKVDQYIQSTEKTVYILDASAVLYQIPIDKYYKNYDMFLIGNLGSKGEQGQIEQLKKEENRVILIKNDDSPRNWQNPEKVREYIKNNYQKTGEIEQFDIYE
ncbi:MAG: hypothetical protein PHP54_06130 [Clostridia bacterium]|nr:hypothetical protein [Clostridia bacterium]